MIRLQIRDFRGCERADVELNPIALVAGRNGAGKTSIAQGAAAALTGNALPITGITKRDAAVLVRSGAETAVALVRGESGTARVDWPAAEVTTSGAPPVASLYAAGLSSIAVMMTPVERARVLSEYLKAEPVIEDLAAALTETATGEHSSHGFADQATVTALWELIRAKGWDGAHQARREAGAELKGRWRQITGPAYGPRLAASWRPDLADEELSEDQLMAAVDEAIANRERAISAVTDSERTAASEKSAAIERDLNAARDRRAALPTGEQPTPTPCPHCGGALVMRRVSQAEVRLEAAGARLTDDELRANRRAIAELDGQIENLLGQRIAAHRERIAAESSAVTRAENRLAQFRKKRDADEIHRRIAGNDQILDLLAPDGLRGRKLAQVLDAFNRGPLAELAEAAGWRSVALDPVMALTYGGRPYALLSTSEQYRVRVVLQVAMAQLDGSPVVVIDAADVLDAPTRAGLVHMIRASHLHALVCMTLSRVDQLPDLAEAGFGASYWIEAGRAEPMANGGRAAA